MSKKMKTALIFAAVMIVLGFIISGFALRRNAADIRQLTENSVFSFPASAESEGHTQRRPIENGVFSFSAIDRVGGEYGGGEDYEICRGELSFPAEQVEELYIAWISGMADIRSYDGEDIKVSETGRGELKEEERMRYKLEDGILSLRFASADARDVQAKSLTVLIPKDMELSEFSVRAVSAETCVDGLDICGYAEFDSVSGNILAERLNTVGLRLENVSGSSEVSGSVGRVKANAVSGRIKLDITDCSGEVNVETVSGSVKLSLGECPCKLDVQTVSGGVDILLPEDSLFALDFDTTSGRCDSEFGNRKDADASFEVETVSGNLTIEIK